MILDCQIRCPNIVIGGLVEYVYLKRRYIVEVNPEYIKCGDKMLYHDYDDIFVLVCLDTDIKSPKTPHNLIYKIEMELDTLKYYENKQNY